MDNYIINEATIYINKNLTGIEREDIIKEELTQVMGLTNDSKTQKDSLFYQYKYANPELYNNMYSPLDKEIIEILYKDEDGWEELENQ